MAFVALSLRAEGYDVYAAVDSSGTYSKLVAEAGIARMVTTLFFFVLTVRYKQEFNQ